MKDIKISNYKVNEREELSFKVLIKPWDFTLAEKELIKNATTNWDYLDMNITWLVNWDADKVRKNKIARLSILMKDFCDKSWYKIDFERNNVYARNKVTSRRDLTDSQLDREILHYDDWLREYN